MDCVKTLLYAVGFGVLGWIISTTAMGLMYAATDVDRETTANLLIYVAVVIAAIFVFAWYGRRRSRPRGATGAGKDAPDPDST